MPTIGPNLNAVRTPSLEVARGVEHLQTNDQARRGEVGAGENRVDEQHAAVHVARHHEGVDLLGVAGKLVQVTGDLAKVTSKGLGATAELVHNEEISESLKHVSEVSGKVMTGLAVLHFGLALKEVSVANKEIGHAHQAQTALEEAARGERELSIADLQANSEAITKGREARTARVEAGLTLLKSGGEIAAFGMETAKFLPEAAGTVAPLVAGAAAGIAMVAKGGYMIHQAGKQQEALTNKMRSHEHASRTADTRWQKANADTLKAAAEDIKASRVKHNERARGFGWSTLGMGIASLALLGAALVVSAPVLLPALAIGMVVGTVGVGVAAAVAKGQRASSERNINTLTQASVQARGQLSGTEINELLSDKKFKKNIGRDLERAGKINEGIFRIDSQLHKLSSTHNPDAKGESMQRMQIVAHLTNSNFVDGAERQNLKDRLLNLNPKNFEAERDGLLSMLSKKALA